MLELGGACHSKWGLGTGSSRDPDPCIHNRQGWASHCTEEQMTKCRHAGQNRELGHGSHIVPAPRVHHS